MTKDMNTRDDANQQIMRRLANIEHRVDSIDQTSAFAMRADAGKHLETIKAIFRRSRRRAQFYLAANGSRSVNEIVEMFGVAQPSVSKELGLLEEEGLLEIFETDGGVHYWGKKPIDRTLGISKYLIEAFDLDKDGQPNS